MVATTEEKRRRAVRSMAGFLQKREGAVAVQDRGRSKIWNLYPTILTPFGSLESDRQEVQRLQKAQMEYGVYACIPGTRHTYEEVIQSLVELDLRRQYEARRQSNRISSPKRHQTIKVKQEGFQVQQVDDVPGVQDRSKRTTERS